MVDYEDHCKCVDQLYVIVSLYLHPFRVEFIWANTLEYMDGLAQDFSNSSALAVIAVLH